MNSERSGRDVGWLRAYDRGIRYARRGGYTPADQRWTLGRIKTLIGKLFHVGYTIEGTGKLMRRHGWSAQVPVRQALERADEAVAVQ
jgi:transposase